ncbi:MAG: GrpB family protein [Holosporaceae bacterium]|jgi:GrpB-like predicted nucleotidyltransferase (UPF0157 family)|nr:GrpB family protein [Holosporaceae bacterium]
MTKTLFGLFDEDLWKIFPVIMSEHQQNWAKIYALEKQLLEKQLGHDKIARINHFGSTTVPGLVAKPIIDILLEIPRDVVIGDLKKKIESIGYICVKSDANFVFLKGYTPTGFLGQIFHLHVRPLNDWDELYFCDYLRKNPKVAEEYDQLKKILSQKFMHNRDIYSEAKTNFIRKITRLARINATMDHNNWPTSEQHLPKVV